MGRTSEGHPGSANRIGCGGRGPASLVGVGVRKGLQGRSVLQCQALFRSPSASTDVHRRPTKCGGRLLLAAAPTFADRSATPRQRDGEPGEGGQQGNGASEGEGDGGGVEHVRHEKDDGHEGGGEQCHRGDRLPGSGRDHLPLVVWVATEPVVRDLPDQEHDRKCRRREGDEEGSALRLVERGERAVKGRLTRNAKSTVTPGRTTRSSLNSSSSS